MRTENQGEESVIRAFTSLVRTFELSDSAFSQNRLMHGYNVVPTIQRIHLAFGTNYSKNSLGIWYQGQKIFARVCSTPKIIQPTAGGAGFNFPRLQLSHGSRFSHLLRDIVHQPKLI